MPVRRSTTSWSFASLSSADRVLWMLVTGSEVQRRTRPASSLAPQPRSSAEKYTCSAAEQRVAGKATLRDVDVMIPYTRP